MSLARVSVVIAAYNAASYLHQAIDSVLNQSLLDWELVVVDDGSSDDTAEIISSYPDSRIVFLRNPKNLGQTASLNRALRELVSGEYVARVDADDFAKPTMLHEMLRRMEQEPALGILGSAKEFVDQNGMYMRTWSPPRDNAAIQETLLSWNCLPHGGAMYRTVCLKDMAGYDESIRYAQDYDLALRITERWDAANLAEPLYCYRWHDSMVSTAKHDEQETCVETARARALARRLGWGWARVTRHRNRTPSWLRTQSNQWVAQRYTWWSMAARGPGRFRYALQFALIALLSDPTSRLTWTYLRGVITRKLQRFPLRVNH